eukprot:763215-Hanusia_phi.AAC.4
MTSSSLQMVTKACRDIAEGEELFVRYKVSSGHQDTLSIREYLHEWYGFWCTCKHCKAYLDRYNLDGLAGVTLN